MIETSPAPDTRHVRRGAAMLLVIIAFSLGLTAGYALRPPGDTDNGARLHAHTPTPPASTAQGYTLDVAWNDLGPRLVAAGGIDVARFTAQYARACQPLTPEQQAILTGASAAPIRVEAANAYFLLNFFWALGLVNRNPVLTEGPITQYSDGDITGFAATGGWTLGAKAPAELFASAALVSLTDEQQARLETAAQGIYRPCCDNPTHFPDCNHGMAMLGLLQVMAASDATVDEMFVAAREVNRVWFPAQAQEVAAFVAARSGQSYEGVDPRLVSGQELFSGTGFRAVRQYLADNRLLPPAPAQGNSCGV